MAYINFPFRMPGIMGGLHAKPNASAISKQLAKAGRDISRYGFPLAYKIIEMLA